MMLVCCQIVWVWHSDTARNHRGILDERHQESQRERERERENAVNSSWVSTHEYNTHTLGCLTHIVPAVKVLGVFIHTVCSTCSHMRIISVCVCVCWKLPWITSEALRCHRSESGKCPDTLAWRRGCGKWKPGTGTPVCVCVCMCLFKFTHLQDGLDS